MKKTLMLVFTLFSIATTQAQFVKERAINASIGLGYSAANVDSDIFGSGFYIQGEYVLTIASWIDVRPYAGFVFTETDEDDNDDPKFRADANAFMVGGKARIKAPIPWVAPYVEIGLGASMGSFNTITKLSNVDDSGLFFHIPFTIGLELGPKHNIDVAFVYYIHNSIKQTTGAAAIGVSIPLK